MRMLRGIALVACVALAAVATAEAAVITIVQGAGFADPTPRAPEGGNSGTTLGQQRLIAFQMAAAIWGGKLQSTQEIKVSAQFTNLSCGPTSGTLGSAGPTNFFVLTDGTPANDRFFAVALAEALLDQNINSANNEINANFNALLDNQSPGCLGGLRWYYGLTGPVPPGSIAFIPTILHELGHGLGFLSLLCDSPGGCGVTPFGGFFSGVPDIWSDFLRDNGFGLRWVQMSDAQRGVSFTNDPLLVWDGPGVNANLAAFEQTMPPETNGGRIRMYAPNPFEDGSSVSHFHEDANPNLLMEPSASADVFNQTDLTDFVFQDIGWVLAGGTPAANQPPTVAGPVNIFVQEDVAGAVAGVSFNDPDAGVGMLTATFSVAQGTLAATGAAGVTVGGTAIARTLTGSVSALNNYIAGNNLTYTTAANATANQTLMVTVNDNGNTGTGGPMSGNRNVTLNVTAVNDAPTLVAPPAYSASEDVAAPLTGIVLSDIDSGTNSVQLAAQVDNGTLSTTGSGVVVTGSGTTSVTLTGSVSAINTFIQNNNLRYTTALNGTAAATLNLTLNDLGNTGTGTQGVANASAAINVTAVNDGPSVAGPATINAQMTGQTTISGVSFADVDVAGGNLAITWAVSAGTMSATTGGGVTVSNDGTASMTTTGTLANLNAFVTGGNVRFTTPGGTADITLTVTANDNGNTGTGGALSGNRQIILSFAQIFRDGFEDP